MSVTASVLAELKAKGSEKTRATYIRHGYAADRVFGVSTADMKTIAKAIKGRQDLALELYDTGFMEAMYLAGMVANGAKMTRGQLNSWAEGSGGMEMISEYTVPWVTVENPQAHDAAIEWIRSNQEHVASSGWCAYTGLLATQKDEALDLAEIERLLESIPNAIPGAENRVRHTMNGFVIAVGTYVKPLLPHSKVTADRVGIVVVDMGDTACKVPQASAAIAKAEAAGRIGQKKKTIRC